MNDFTSSDENFRIISFYWASKWPYILNIIDIRLTIHSYMPIFQVISIHILINLFKKIIFCLWNYRTYWIINHPRIQAELQLMTWFQRVSAVVLRPLYWLSISQRVNLRLFWVYLDFSVRLNHALNWSPCAYRRPTCFSTSMSPNDI